MTAQIAASRPGETAPDTAGEPGGFPTKVHAVANRKGGVGKTTLAVNLAAVTYSVLAQPSPIMLEAAESVGDPNSPVLLVSTDPHASAVWWSRRVEASRGEGGLPFDYVQVRQPSELAQLRSSGRWRHVFVDTPGSLDDESLLQAVLEECDDILVPLPPEPLAYDPTRQTIDEVIVPCAVPYRVVINNWDPRDGTPDLKQTGEYVRRKGWPLCNSIIRRYKVHTRAAADGQVVTQYAASRVALQAREDFYQLALECGYGGSTVPRQLAPATAGAVS